MSRSFPGATTDFLQVASDAPALDVVGATLTLSAWVFVNNFAAAQRCVIGKSTNTSAAAQYRLAFTTAALLAFTISDGTAAEVALGATTLSTGVWIHIAGVKYGTGGGATQKVFVNGVEDASISSTRNIWDTANLFTIGRRSTANDPFDGRIAEVAVWDVALAAAEILALAKGASPLRVRPGTSLKGYFPLYGVAYPEIDLGGRVIDPAQNGTVAAGVGHAPVGPVLF